MTNLYEIEWSNQAIHNFEEIVGYLSNSWNEKVVKDFVRSVDRAVTHITICSHMLFRLLLTNRE